MSITSNIPFVIKTNGSVTLYLKSECMTIAQDHPNYNKIIDALKTGNFGVIENLVNVGRAVTTYSKGQIAINNGELYYNGSVIHNTLTERILKMMAEGFKIEHMLNFLANLMSNPSFRATNETYKFLENHGLPITDDGCFLGYKAVRNNYTDMRTGKFNNSVGQVVKMERNRVDENYHQDCSYGLHVGSLGYVESFGGFTRNASVGTGNRLLIVKVNPKDVVSVPEYAGHTKMRVCEYTVVDEIKDIVKEMDKASVYKADATPLTPDFKEEVLPVAKKTVSKQSSGVDTTSGWNEAEYLTGWEAAEADVENGDNYGYSRDYTASNSYRLGYNDRFNGRPNQAFGSTCSTNCSCNSQVEDDYNKGYELGESDAESGSPYQESLDIGASEDFKDGYSDGYNDHR